MEMALLYDGVLTFAEASKEADFHPIQLDCSDTVWDEGSSYKNYLAMVSFVNKTIYICNNYTSFRAQ